MELKPHTPSLGQWLRHAAKDALLFAVDLLEARANQFSRTHRS